MTNYGTVITGKQIKHSEKNILVDVAKGGPSQILVYIQEPTDLAAIQALYPYNNMFPSFPMVKMLDIEAELLASICVQAVSTLDASKLFLLTYNEVSGKPFKHYVETFMNNFVEVFTDYMDHPPGNLKYIVCASAADFLDEKSDANLFLEILAKKQYPFGIGIMLSNVSQSMNILKNEEFRKLANEVDVTFLLLKMGEDLWNLSEVMEFQKDIVFWSSDVFLQYEQSSETKPSIPIIAMISVVYDKISVWDDKTLTGTVLRKIRIGDPEEAVVNIENVRGKKIGYLQGGGFVNLANFMIRYLE